ncbi:hypothetical protein [Xanthocytophaga agilis]|uniref:Uncharacterized protein n=1 Tax=Xanthocytophaga agilis TaxID=3048010 RepID=A0AAE3RCI0_9BACT|nr:hypothetical protein [Xanthocytophaga agilis]MDJ1505729.1 hypothetical protein [Xanthocytophaga agilis]
MNTNDEQMNKDIALDKLIVLIKSVPGGSRAHIITLSKDGRLSYKIGSIEDLSAFNENKIEIDKSYKKIRKQLTNVEIQEIKGYLSADKAMIYNDTKTVKDNFQYLLFVNGDKKAFVYEKNFDDYPENFRKIITFLLEKTGTLYKIPEMS